MPTTQADTQAARNAGIVALAANQLSGLWPQVDWDSPDAAAAVKTVYGGIVKRFGSAAAVVAAQSYNERRATHDLSSHYTAVPGDPFPQAAIDKAVDSAFLGGNPNTLQVTSDATPPGKADTTSDLPVDQRVEKRLTTTLQRRVMQPARDTVAQNAVADPAKPRYVRVPQGATTCAFCVLLASRDLGPIDGPQKRSFGGYTSAKSAQFVVGRGRALGTRRGGKPGGSKGKGVNARGDQSLGDKYHDHCDCEPVAIYGGQDVVEVSPNFYDYQDMYYKATADAGTNRDTKKILAAMRSLHGLK